MRLFLSTLVLVLISSGIQAGTYHSGDKKKEVYIGRKEREREVTMFFIVASFLFALYRTMKFRIHFCLIVTLFFI